ncbi:MAG: hypothetical protein RLZZ536_251 [Planctomycetota bacterium]
MQVDRPGFVSPENNKITNSPGNSEGVLRISASDMNIRRSFLEPLKTVSCLP